MKLNIAVLPGDGIGPEIMEQGVAVLNTIAAKFGHEIEYKTAICGADAIDKVGDPFLMRLSRYVNGQTPYCLRLLATLALITTLLLK